MSYTIDEEGCLESFPNFNNVVPKTVIKVQEVHNNNSNYMAEQKKYSDGNFLILSEIVA